VTLGVDNIFNYKPKTLGAGITMFNIPATAGTRGHIQVEFDIDELMKLAKKKK
jgi:outer membrane receptor for ferrienterochelin and colicins